MGLGDPAQIGYEAGQQQANAIPQAFDKSFGYLAQEDQKNKQRKEAFDMLKKFGMVKTKTEDPSLDELAQGAKDFAKQEGHDLNINYGDNPEQAKNNIMAIYKALNIPMPKGKTTTELNLAPGTEYDPMKGSLSVKGEKKEKSLPEQIAEYGTAQKLLEQAGLNGQASVGPKGATIKPENIAADNSEWDKIDKIANPLVATNRSPLGMAGRTTLAANRALKILDSDNIPSQQVNGVTADIASILQNGSPTEFGMSEQGYNSAFQTFAKVAQYASGKPVNALTPELKTELQRVLNDMKSVNKDVIRQNFDALEAKNKKLISKDPERWSEYRKILESDDYSGSGKKSGQLVNNKTSNGVGYTIEQ